MKKPRPPAKPTTKRRTARPAPKPTTKTPPAKRMPTTKAVAPAPPAPPAGPPSPASERRTGRPSKLTDDVQQVIVDAITRGNIYSASAERAGIDYATFKRWMEKGEREEPEFTRYRAFRAAILVANAECQDVQLTRINHAASHGTWQAAAWILERRFPEEWGRKDKVQHEGADAFATFLDEVARKRAEQLAAAGTTSTDDAA